jgi:hypothetical protein
MLDEKLGIEELGEECTVLGINVILLFHFRYRSSPVTKHLSLFVHLFKNLLKPGS